MIAGFIFLRLRGILGKRTGFEGKTPPQLDKILKDEKPKPGSYRGRINNEPENGRKTLMELKNA